MAKAVCWRLGLIGALVGGAQGRGERSLSDIPLSITALEAEEISTAALPLDALLRQVNLVDTHQNVQVRGVGSRPDLFVNGSRSGLPHVIVRGGIGYHEDPTENGSDGTEFFDLNLLSGLSIVRGPTTVQGVLGAGFRYYGDEVENADDDQFTFDLNGALHFQRNFSDSVRLDTLVIGHYGDHGSSGSLYLRPGLQWNEVFDWQSRTALSYRFDGLELGSKGWGFSTYYTSGGFLEGGGDERDSFRLSIGQELRTTINDTTTLFLDGQYGLRTWDKWDDFDSNALTFVGGIRTGGQDWSVDASAGWSWSDYDDLDEDHDSFASEVYFNRAFTPDLQLTLKARYGVQELYANDWGTEFVDPSGLLLASRLEYRVNDAASLALSFTMLDVESEFTSEDYHRGAIGLNGTFKLSENLTLNPGLVWINPDDTPSDVDDYLVASLRLGTSF